MTVERPNVESADKIEAVDKLSRGIGVRQGTKLGVWWWWQISQNQQVNKFSEQLEEEVSVDGAKHWVHAEVEEEHFVDPGQGFHPEQTCKRCLLMFYDGELKKWRRLLLRRTSSTIASICAWIVSMRGQRTGQCQCSTQPRWCATKSGRKMIAFNIFYLDRYPYFENVHTCMMYSFN